MTKTSLNKISELKLSKKSVFDWKSMFWLLLISGFSILISINFYGVLTFVFGVGWFVPVFISFIILFILWLFKRFVFKLLNKNFDHKHDSNLIQYLTEENQVGLLTDNNIQSELLEKALDLKSVFVKDCMTLRRDIVSIDIKKSIEDLRKLFEESNLSRLVVVENNLDNVVGYVHVQKLFLQPNDIKSIVFPIDFVSETLTVNRYLSKASQTGVGIACVINDKKNVIGLITLEDALEQLFGFIDDEFDSN